MRSCGRFRPGACPRLAIALIALCVLGSAPASAAPGPAGQWTIGPPPPWVKELPLPAPGRIPESGVTSGRVGLIADHQVRIGAHTIEYQRRAWTPTSSEGVQNASEI